MKVKVIPTGFKLKFHSSFKSHAPNKHLLQCSRNLMHVSLTNFNKSAATCSRKMNTLVQQLNYFCGNREIFTPIRRKMHDLNNRLFVFLRDVKQSKFERLVTPDHPNRDHHSADATSKCSVRKIPEDVPLSHDELSVLNKGLKFIPEKNTIDQFQTIHDTETFFRRLRLKAFFHNKIQNSQSCDDRSPTETLIDNLFSTRSKWTPPQGLHSSLDYYIEKCRHEISMINYSKKIKTSSLTESKIDALEKLKSRDDIVIKPADKGGRVVVWNKDHYIEEGQSQLEKN